MMISPYLFSLTILFTPPSHAEAETSVGAARPPRCEASFTRGVARDFPDVATARSTVSARRAMLEHFLEREEFIRLDTALYRAERASAAADDVSRELRVISELIDRAMVLVFSTMQTHGHLLRRELLAKRRQAFAWNNLGTAERLAETLSRLRECVERRRHKRCVDAWYSSRKFLAVELMPMHPEESPAGAPIPRPINEVAKLNVLKTFDRKTQFKVLLEHAFREESEAPYYAIRSLLAGRRRQHEFPLVPDLNFALTALFVNVPTPAQRVARAALDGHTFVDDEVVPIQIVFDARARVFSVERPGEASSPARFYAVELSGDGRLWLLSPHAMTEEDVAARFGRSHFRY